MLKLLISGINGKMGKVIYNLAIKNPEIEVVAGVDKFCDGIFCCKVYKSFTELDAKADVIIDFSRPELLNDILNYAVKSKTAAVLCTTGYSQEDLNLINKAALKIPIFMSGNMSMGINLLIMLCKKAAAFLGEGYDIEIIEKHHNEKIDAPSGTALMLANAINEELNNSKEYVYERQSRREKRKASEIGIHSVRGGTIVGEHEVMFTAFDETITLSHSAQSKTIFANGALKAAFFIKGKPPKIYSMKDMEK